MAKTFDQLVPSAPKGRFDGISRPYTPAEMEKLRGSFPIAYTLAERAANRLRDSLHKMPYVHSLGAVTEGDWRLLNGSAKAAARLPE
jgi:isocitrate lyase